MTHPTVELRPLVSWPHQPQAGRSYLVTVDVELAGTGPVPEWPYEQEEFAIGCMLAGCPGVEIEAIGATALVLHRYGGTYGPARFAVHVAADFPPPEPEPARLRLTLVTAGGIPFRTLDLPLGTDPDAGADEQPTVPLPPRAREPDAPAPADGAEPRYGWGPRVEQVVAVTVPETGFRASGYEIARDLVLTVLPLGVHPGAVLWVHEPDGTVLDATVAWAGSVWWQESIGLIHLTDRAPGSVRWSATVGWGALVTDGETPCRVLGASEPWPMDGSLVQAFSRSGFLRQDGTPRRGPATYSLTPFTWGAPGAAGSAVFCGDLLAGVLVGHDPLRAEARVLPCAELMGDPAFREVLARHPSRADLRLEPVEWQEWADLLPTREQRAWHSPAALLRARNEVLPFHGRAGLLADLDGWSREPGTGTALVHGAGGQGKTRLAQELGNLLTADGWAVLWLRGDAPVEDLGRLTLATVPALVVVDYAEGRVEQVTGLLAALAARRPGTPFKLLLLARTAGDWWSELRAADRAAEELLEAAFVFELPSLEYELGSFGAEEYLLAVHGFAAALPEVMGWRGHDWPGIAERLVDARISGDHPGVGAAGTMLALHMTALADLLDTARRIAGGTEGQEETRGSEDFEDRLLQHEEWYWLELAEARGLRTVLSHAGRFGALAAAFMFGAEDEEQADALLRRVPGLAGLAEEQRAAVRAWIGAVAPSAHPRPWDSLQPDRLNERFIGRCLDADPGFADHLLPAVSPAQATRFVGVCARAATHPVFDDRLGRQLTELCVGHAVLLGPVAVDVAVRTEDPGPLLDALRQITDRPGTPLAELERLAARLPKQSERLAFRALRLTERLAAEYRALADTDPAHLPRLADHLNDLGLRLLGTGDRAGALAATGETVAIRRALAASDPDAHLPALATGLSNLGVQLAEQGRFDEALTATEEAVAIRRGSAGPGAEPAFAAALSNLGVRYATVGRHQEALAASREAVDTYRRLADANPGAHLPGLAGSLVNLAGELGQSAGHAEALAVASEAVDTYRRLAEANPDAHLPNLATGLDSLSTRLADLDRHAESLSAGTEAVSIRRRLAAANPDAHLPDLAAGLVNLAAALVERREEAAALAVVTEATDIYRRLAEVSPAAYLPGLSMSLGNLAATLTALGRGAEALSAFGEAVSVRRQLAAADPAAHLPDLATELIGLAALLHGQGEQEAALAAAAEGVDIRRRLADANPDVHLPGLRASLNLLATLSGMADRDAEDLAAMEESVSVRRQLAADDPDAHLPALAASLLVLADRLDASGRAEEAARVRAEAADVYRRMDPEALIPEDVRRGLPHRAAIWYDHGGSSAG
ncbi:tetratricopeptide repeat protein [Kitasatospora sp. NPDC004272]